MEHPAHITPPGLPRERRACLIWLRSAAALHLAHRKLGTVSVKRMPIAHRPSPAPPLNCDREISISAVGANNICSLDRNLRLT